MPQLSRAELLLELVDLEHLERDLYRGNHEHTDNSRLFGGQVLAQALAAAGLTVATDRHCHSLHGYFLRPGRPDIPAIYRVERIRDGRSFTTRRIVAIQNGEAIFSMDASFQLSEKGLQHQIDVGDLPPPEDLEDDIKFAERPENNVWAARERPFEMRSANQLIPAGDSPLNNPVWIRYKSQFDGNRQLHQQLLAYASDMSLISTSLLAHRAEMQRSEAQMASLDHALWFHRDFDVCDWLVYVKESRSTEMARAFNRGSFYTRQGTLVASSMQEGLMRIRAGS